MFFKNTHRCILLLLFLAASLAAAPNLIVNGSFEQPNLTGNTTNEIFTPGSHGIDSWVVTGFGPSQVSVNRDTQMDGNLTFNAHTGDQSLNLTGASPGEAAGVRQVVQLVKGEEYKLTFWVGNQDNNSVNYPIDASAALLVDGQFIDIYTNGHNTHNEVNWREFSYTFTATKINTSIEFQNATLTFEHYVGLDTVDLQLIPQQVTAPEPATLGLAGLALLLAGLRRLTRAAAPPVYPKTR